MVTMFKPKPQLLRAVDKPDNVSTQEIAKARPVYIDGLPEGGGGGGSSTTDAITIEGISDVIANGYLLNDYIRDVMTDMVGLAAELGDLVTRIEALENPDG